MSEGAEPPPGVRPGALASGITIAETVEAILQYDLPKLREAFKRIVMHGGESTTVSKQIWRGLVLEVCSALSDDVSPMPRLLCEAIGKVVGTTYARGADAFAATLRSS